MKRQVFQQLTAERAMTVQRACQLLGISRSEFYAARQRTRQLPAVCGTRIRLRSVLEATGRSYGSHRLRQELTEQGIEIRRHQVRSLMRELQLKPIWQSKFVHTTVTFKKLIVKQTCILVKCDKKYSYAYSMDLH